MEIYSMDGQLVYNVTLAPDADLAEWVPGDMPAGSYLVVLKSNHNKVLQTKKIIYTK